MRIVVQRVKRASVSVDQQTIGQISHGLLLLVGFGINDIDPDLARIAQRVADLRVFEDKHSGKLSHSVKEVNGGILAVPQFALYGETNKGRRPSFHNAMAPIPARTYFEHFINALNNTGIKPIEAGKFGADMQVSLVNDGPLTLILEY